MKSWLKGGLIGLVLYIVLALLGFFIFAPSVLMLMALSSPSSVLIGAPAIIGAITFFLIGAFIGWIVGKIKNRNEENKK